MLLLLAACATSEPGDTAATSGEAVPTDAGLYDVTLSPEPDPPAAGDAALGIDVTHDGEPVSGATVTVDCWMAAMGHGTSDPPVVEDQGDGHYVATWVYPMAGSWDVTITIDGEPGTDTMTATYDVR